MYSKRSGIRQKAMKGGFLPMMGMMGNPMEMVGKMMGMMVRGVVNSQYPYHGAGVVNSQYPYQGKGVVNNQQQYHGGMDAATFFNPMTSPLSPISMFKNMFGLGQVGGRRKKTAAAAAGGCDAKQFTVQKKLSRAQRGARIKQIMRDYKVGMIKASQILKSMCHGMEFE
jgi:hypothetical protein